jgi:hypothetical protein
MSRRTLLGAGLLTLAGVGGATGYGVGLFLTDEPSLAGAASPLPMSPGSTPTRTPSPAPPSQKITYDDSPALRAEDLRYKTRTFEVKSVVRSEVTVRVPGDWDLTRPDPPKTGRFTDPTGKRWIRLEAGFTIKRPPATSMGIRITELNKLPANQMLRLISQSVDEHYATISYTYVPPPEQSPEGILRYVVVRWVADDSGNCAVEMSSTGLPQDKAALMDVLDHAADSVERRDSPL